MNLPTFTELTDEQELQSQDLQRTESWHQERLGLFTGSRIGDLMTCKSKKAGKNWNEHFWLFDFGDTALNYISERAIERATGQRIETPTTWQMAWGTQNEPIGREKAAEKLGVTIQEVGFKKFLKNAGASADGLINNDTAFEIKCPATVKSHRNLMLSDIDESHEYFWQLQSEMLALGVDKLIFATYSPHYPEKSQIGIKDANLSKVHVFAMKIRLIISEMLVKKIIETDFLCDDRAELDAIANKVPTDHSGLENWFMENIKYLEL